MPVLETTAQVADATHLILERPLHAQGLVKVSITYDDPEQEDAGDFEAEVWLRAASQNGAFDFLKDSSEDIYSPEDGRPLSG